MITDELDKSSALGYIHDWGKVSIYARKNAAEAFAESFASAWYNKENTPEEAKRIIRVIAQAALQKGESAVNADLLKMIGE